MYARTIAELTLMVNSAIDEVLLSHVAPVVKDNIKKHIQADVYDGFSTTMDRRGSDGGLIDDKNIVSELVGEGSLLSMSVAFSGDSVMGTTITPDSRTMFSRWINDGDWMDLSVWGKTGTKVKRAARPFISNAREDLKSNQGEWIDALRSGLQMKGLRI